MARLFCDGPKREVCERPIFPANATSATYRGSSQEQLHRTPPARCARSARRGRSFPVPVCRHTVVAVGAPHYALRDLGFNASPTRAPGDHQREVERLVPKVVELEHDDVALAAIDAGMGEQIFDRLGARLSATPAAGDNDALPHRLRVLPVVPLVGHGETATAPGLELVGLGSPDWRKLIQRFRLAAPRAGLHLHT